MLKYTHLKFTLDFHGQNLYCVACKKECFKFVQGRGWVWDLSDYIIPDENIDFGFSNPGPCAGIIADTQKTVTKSATYLVELESVAMGMNYPAPCAKIKPSPDQPSRYSHMAYPILSNSNFPDPNKIYRVPGLVISNYSIILCPCLNYKPNVSIISTRPSPLVCGNEYNINEIMINDPCRQRGNCKPPRFQKCSFPGVVELYKIISQTEDAIMLDFECDKMLYGEGEEYICKDAPFFGETGWIRKKAVNNTIYGRVVVEGINA